jgi:hypothetical protein
MATSDDDTAALKAVGAVVADEDGMRIAAEDVPGMTDGDERERESEREMRDRASERERDERESERERDERERERERE